MTTAHSARTLFLVVLLFMFVLETEADAYLDPGTGSYVLQMLLAAVLGGLAFIKPIWRKVKGLFVLERESTEQVEDGGE